MIFPLSENISGINKPQVSPTERPPLPVSAGGAAVTPNSEVPGKRPQHEGSGASCATALGTCGGVSTLWAQAVISLLYSE